jgi:hypothetical protein
MTTQQFILIDCVCLFLLGVATYFTRATLRRLLGALVGGVAATLLGVGFDVAGHSLGWWHYVGVTTPYGPPLMYVALGLWYGAGVALIGWRITRRYGWQGQVAFIGGMAVYGPIRDYVGVALSKNRLQVIAPGIMPVVGDVILWASVIAAAQGVMRLVAGSAQNDQLAPRPIDFRRAPLATSEPRTRKDQRQEKC